MKRKKRGKQKAKNGYVVLSFRVRPRDRKRYHNIMRTMMFNDGYVMIKFPTL